MLKPLSRALLYFVLLTLPAALAYTNDEEEPVIGWKNQVVGSFNLTQASFDNWSQGGENNLAWATALNGSFVYHQPKYAITNTMKIAYGQAKVGDLESRKSADEIRLESLYEYKLGGDFNPYVSGQVITQLAKGYQYTEDEKLTVSNFFDPGYLTFAAGIGYTPAEYLKTRLGAATKITITREFATALTDDPATESLEKSDVEFGIQSVTELKKQLAENMLLTSKVELFSDLNRMDETDVRWDTILSIKVSRFIDVSANVELFYDKTVSPKRQLKQILALGLSYTFL